MASIILKHCPLCYSTHFKFLRKAKSGVRSLYRCCNPDCCLDFQVKYPTRILSNYNAQYAERYKLDPQVEDFRTNEAIWLALWLAKNNINTDFGLEVGFNTGSFSKQLMDTGWKMRGVELIPECVEEGKKIGIEAIQGNWESPRFHYPHQQHKPSLGLMIHTIEHFQHPLHAFHKLVLSLSRNAIVYIHTPNADNGIPGWFHDHEEHLCLFGKTALHKLFSSCNVQFLESREIHVDDLIFIGRKK